MTRAHRRQITAEFNFRFQEPSMRSLLLLFLGIPIPIIILIALFT